MTRQTRRKTFCDSEELWYARCDSEELWYAR